MTKIRKDKIRIKDIAEMAHVSTGTVDRVLHDRGEVSVETRKQILGIVDKLGYTPNLLAKSLALKKTYEFTILIPSSANENLYWEKPLSGINKAGIEIKDFNSVLNILFFDLHNENSFKDAVLRTINSKTDGIIFTPAFPESSLQLICHCDKNNLSYIFLDVNIEEHNNLAYFGQNAFKSGLLAAHLFDYGIEENAGILIVKLANISGNTHHLMKREIGFRNYFENNTLSKKIDLLTLDLNINKKDELELLLLKTIERTGNIKGIFVTNSRVNSVAAFIEKKGFNNIILIGYDVTPANRTFLEKGTISFLIGQKPEEQGYRSVLALFNHLVFKREIQKMNYSPIDILTRENIEFY